jgi:hypothetical protein
MKGKIDEYGILHVFRRGEMREQKCPYAAIDQVPNVYSVCSDFCPHFGEPEEEWFDGGLEKDLISCGRFKLRLCHGTVLAFDEFTDERSAT